MKIVRRNGRGFAALVALLSVVPAAWSATPTAPTGKCAQPVHRPRPCTGFIPPNYWGETRGVCPPDYAVYALEDPAGDVRRPEHFPLQITCCPLPASDILTDEHVWETVVCPANYVLTGADNNVESRRMRCTKINTRRYSLESFVQQFVYWGDGESGYQGALKISRDIIPFGLRSAVGRTSNTTWGNDGCVASINPNSPLIEDWGGLMFGRGGKWCSQFDFHRLKFDGMEGDPRADTIVPLFAACTAPPNPEAPIASCPGAAAPFPCEDGVDNDNDGFIDLGDSGCECPEDDEDSPEVPDDNNPPTIENLNPRWGSSAVGETVHLMATYGDRDGVDDLHSVGLLVSTAVRQTNTVFARYNVAQNLFELANDDGSFTQACVAGSAMTLANSFGRLDCTTSASFRSDDDLISVRWSVAFLQPYVGQTHEIFLRAIDLHDSDTNWQPWGSWTVGQGGGTGDGGMGDGGIIDPTRPDIRLQGGGCTIPVEPVGLFGLLTLLVLLRLTKSRSS